MPNLWYWGFALALAWLASASCVWLLQRLDRASGLRTLLARGQVPWGVGIWLGLAVLQSLPAWPPAKAIDRWLILVLPAASLLEIVSLLAAPGRMVPRAETPAYLGLNQKTATLMARSLWLKGLLAVLFVRVLLHDSVYLQQPKAWLVVGGWAALLALLLTTTERVAERAVGRSLCLTVAATIMASGMVVMLAGYLKGGLVPLVCGSALVGSTLAGGVQGRWNESLAKENYQGLLKLGMLALFGFLVIGHLFGRVALSTVLGLLLLPLLVSLVDLPRFQTLTQGQKALWRVALVALVLGGIVGYAKMQFDQQMGPLLERVGSDGLGCEHIAKQALGPPLAFVLLNLVTV